MPFSADQVLYLNEDNVYGADELGLPFRDIMGEGVVGSGDFAVSQRAAGANMSVDVAAGACWIKGDDDADLQPTYRYREAATTNLAITAADATDPRIDRIVAEVLDDAFSGVSRLGRLRAVDGTPTAGATLTNLSGAASVPNNALLLANVLVGNGVSSIADADIADVRPRAAVGAGSALGAYALLHDETLGSAASSIDIPDIPAGFEDLRVVAELQGSAAGTGVQVYLRINNDSGGTQYSYGQLYIGGSGASSSADHMYLCDVAAAGVGGSEFNVLDFAVNGYAGTSKQKSLSGLSFQAAAARIWMFGGGWKSTSAVNRLTLYPASGNFVAGSRVRIYGRR